MSTSIKNKIKLVTIFVLSVVVFATLFYFFANFLNSKVNQAVYNLADKLTARVGQTVKIGSITTKWHGINLKIDIKDLVVLDNESQTPLIMVNNIVSTVDALKSLFSLSVKFKHLVLQSPRLAIQWDGLNPPVILGLSGNNLHTNLNFSEFLQLLAQQHNISIQNGEVHIQGLNQADIPLMDVALEIREQAGLDFLVILRGSVAAANPPEFNAAVHFIGSIADPNKFMLDFEIKTSNLQVDDLLNLIPKYKQNLIQGAFTELDIKGAIQNGALRYVNTDFNVEHLQVGSDMEIVGGKGAILFKPTSDHIHITAQNLTLKEYDNPKYIFTVQELTGDIKSFLKGDELELLSDNMYLKLLNMEFKSEVAVSLTSDTITTFKLATKMHNAAVPKVVSLLPTRVLGQTVTKWLQQSLLAGEVESIDLKYLENKLFFKTELRNTELKYSNAWPSIQSIDAAIVLDNRKLSILTTNASILHTKINNLTTDFAAKNNRDFMLVNLSGNLDTNLETTLAFLQQTPLKDKLGAKISALSPKGDCHLALKLDIDLSDSKEVGVAVHGDLDLKEDALQLPEMKLSLTNINGKVKFTNDSLSAKDLHLHLVNYPATASLLLEPGGGKDLQIKIESQVQVNTLKELFPELNLANISGKTAFAAKVIMPWAAVGSERTIYVTSNLEGVTLDFPQPLYKAPQSKMPLQIKCQVKSNNDKLFYIKLADLVDANIFIVNGKATGGHIAINSGTAPLGNDKQLMLSGKIPSLDWDAWSIWLQNNPSEGLGTMGLDLFIKQLTFRGEKYQDVSVKYDVTSNNYVLDSSVVKGVINISKEADKISIQLDRLNLGETKVTDNVVIKTLKEKNAQKQLPIIQFYCEDFRLNKQQFRKVSVQLLPRTYGYEIIDLAISNDNILLQAQGQWQMENREFTQLSGNAYTKNLGLVVQDLNIGKSIGKGNGELNFALEWDGDPTQFSLTKLNGTSHVELQNGVITGVNPGLGRIIGLLSIESIQRRLKLDFSDLDSKGLAFDTLTCDMNLDAGIVSTDKMLINCPSARIELSGKSNLNTHDLNFEMYVTPKVGIGLPVAAALAVGNPVVGAAAGAAVWLFDQATGSKISEITRYRYQVTGTWEAPKIIETTSENNPKSDPPTKN